MLSSLNSFGGLSAAQLLTLFGANSSSSSSASSSTSASATQTAPTTAPTTGANDPAATIKAILAQSQIATSIVGSASIASVEAAYANQTSSAAFLTNVESAEPEPSLSESLASSMTNTSTAGLAINLSQQNVGADVTISRSYSVDVTPVGASLNVAAAQAQTPSAGSDAATAAASAQPSNATDAAGSTSSSDYFQLSGSIEEQSDGESAALAVDLGFSVAGLGNMTATNDESIQANTPDAQYSYQDLFQLNIVQNGQVSFVTLNVLGLDASQAQDVLTAFESAAASANIAPLQNDYNSNLSITYIAGIGNNAGSAGFTTPNTAASSQQT